MISYIDAHKILRFPSERKTSISPIKSQLKTYISLQDVTVLASSQSKNIIVNLRMKNNVPIYT